MSGELPPGVIQLNSEAQPRFNPRPSPPPVHPMPQPNGAAAGGIPHGVPPAGMRPANQPTMLKGLQLPLPPPPLHAIPKDLRSRQRVKISDIRDERLTEADAFERLSSFVVLRLERANNSSDPDELSHPKRSKWETVYQIEQSGISRQEAARQVAHLDRETKPVLEKKDALSPIIQRQLEAAGEDLARTDPDPRYHYKLVQFASQERRIDPRQLEYASRNKREKKYSKHGKKEKSRPKYERVAITAYFKRIPKSGQSFKRMLEDREREREREQQLSQQTNLPHSAQQIPLQMPAQMPAHFLSAAQSMGGTQFVPGGPVNPMAPAMPKLNPQDKQMKPNQQDKQEANVKPGNQAAQSKPINQERPDKQANSGQDKQNKPAGKGKPAIEIVTNGKRSQGYHGSPRSSRSSLSSEASYSTNGSNFMTPQSSIGSSSPSSKHDRGRTLVRGQHQGQPEHFGVDPLRQHSKEEAHYVLDGYPARRALSPSLPYPVDVLSPREMDPIRQGRYPNHFEDEDSWRPRVLPPRVIQGGVRRVTPPEAKREIRSNGIDRAGSRLERLRLADVKHHERRLRFDDEDDEFDGLQEDIRLRRGLQARLRGRRADDYMPVEQRDRWPELEARTYMINRERPIVVESSRPISSMARRGGDAREHYI